jgi:hypothetical protein
MAADLIVLYCGCTDLFYYVCCSFAYSDSSWSLNYLLRLIGWGGWKLIMPSMNPVDKRFTWDPW